MKLEIVLYYNDQVPKLWEPKHSSECLGSSWGSAASSTLGNNTKNVDGSSTTTSKIKHTPETGKSLHSNHVDSNPSTVRHVAPKGMTRKIY